MIKTPSKPTNYTIVCNEVARRDDLSARAKGIYYYLATLPHDWQLSQSELFTHFTEGKDALRTAFKELVDAGYIVETIKRDEAGHIKGKNYKVLWTIELDRVTDLPFSEKPTSDKPISGNPPLLNTDNNKVLKKQSKESMPTFEEFEEYCTEELGDYILDAENIYESYKVNNWRDSRDNPIKNWKTKLRQVWCKPERKRQAPQIPVGMPKEALEKLTVEEWNGLEKCEKDGIIAIIQANKERANAQR